jgi:hypothetical protein
MRRRPFNLVNSLLILAIVVTVLLVCSDQALGEGPVTGIESWDALVMDENKRPDQNLTKYAKAELVKHGMKMDEQASSSKHARLFVYVTCWHEAGQIPLHEEAVPTVTQMCTVDIDVVRVANLYPGYYRLVSTWSALGRVTAPRVRSQIAEFISMISELREEQPEA